MRIEEFFSNNKVWVADKLRIDPDYFTKLAVGQAPCFLYVSCSDSRVSAEELIGVKPG